MRGVLRQVYRTGLRCTVECVNDVQGAKLRNSTTTLYNVSRQHNTRGTATKRRPLEDVARPSVSVSHLSFKLCISSSSEALKQRRARDQEGGGPDGALPPLLLSPESPLFPAQLAKERARGGRERIGLCQEREAR